MWAKIRFGFIKTNKKRGEYMNNFDRIEPPMSKEKWYRFTALASAKISGFVYAENVNEAIKKIQEKNIEEPFTEEILNIEDVESLKEES